MKSLTVAECIALLKTYGVEITSDDRFSQILKKTPFSSFDSAKFSMPKDSGRKVALMRLIFGQFSQECGVFVWLKNLDVWGSSGHKPLLVRLREALGCRQRLEESPGHLFLATEVDDAISFLVLSAEFFWDCLVVCPDLGVTVFLSHDEFYIIACKEKKRLIQIQDILENGKWTI